MGSGGLFLFLTFFGKWTIFKVFIVFYYSIASVVYVLFLAEGHVGS